MVNTTTRTLCVPCYNAAHLLPYFFASVAAMNPKPDHIIFTHNNCTDGTDVLLGVSQAEFMAKYNMDIDIIPLHFSKNFVRKHGSYEHMAIICQRLWDRAKAINADYTYLTACDTFAASPDILTILSDWGVDFVTARVVRGFPEGVCIAAKWRHPTNPHLHRMAKVGALRRWLIPDELCVGRPVASSVFTDSNGLKSMLDDTPLMASGFYCWSRRLLRDKRMRWHPLPKSEIEGDRCSEDFGFCLTALRSGYKVCLDGIAIVDHVLYDSRHERKAWSKEVEDGKESFTFNGGA